MKISSRWLAFSQVEVRDIANQSEDSYIIIPPKLNAKLSSSQKTKANGEGRRYQTETCDIYQLDLMSVVGFLFGKDHDVVERRDD